MSNNNDDENAGGQNVALDLCRHRPPSVNHHGAGTDDGGNHNSGESQNNNTHHDRRRLLAKRGYVGVAEGCTKVRFATVGDVHGQFALVAKKLRELDGNVDFVLQVGDIECHRNEEDLQSMAAPSKFRTMGDFGSSLCHNARRQDDYLDHPMYFIGGNHECYGWLDDEDHYNLNHSSTTTSQQEAFLEVAPNVFYLGRAGYLPLRFFEKRQLPRNGADNNTSKPSPRQQQDLDDDDDDDDDEEGMNILGLLHLGFLSGIHCPDDFYHRRPAMTRANLDVVSNKRWIGFNVYDTQVLLTDEEGDDGIEHNSHHGDNEYDGGGLSSSHCQDLSSPRQRLKLSLARLLGVNLTFPQEQDAAVDVRLSVADVRFLMRFLFPLTVDESRETTIQKRRDKLDVLPRNLNGIVDTLLDEYSTKDGGDIDKLIRHKLRRKRAVDVLLTHDWPAGCVAEAELYASSDNKRSRPVGNAVCRELLDGLKPLVHCCGHMHCGYRQQIKHTTPKGKPSKKTSELCCLGKVGLSGSAAFAVFELDLETGEIVEINKDPRLSRLGPLEEDVDDEIH